MAETTEQYRNRINQLKTSIENEPYMKNMRPDIAEGISKTGNRQADIEIRQNSLEDDFAAVQTDARSTSPSGAELAVAAGVHDTIGDRFDFIEERIQHVSYEMFRLEGMTDSEVVRATHEYANLNKLNVINSSGEYWLDAGTEIPIKTNVDWGTTKFHMTAEKKRHFIIQPETSLETIVLGSSSKVSLLQRLKKGANTLPELSSYANYFIKIANENKAIASRNHPTASQEFKLEEYFYLDEGGRLQSPIDYNFDDYTSIVGKSANHAHITISGGMFLITPNNSTELSASYVQIGLGIERNRVTIENQTIAYETTVDNPNPLSGFYNYLNVYDLTFRNIRGVSQKESFSGSYGFYGQYVVRLGFDNVTGDSDEGYWGVQGHNKIKDMTIRDSTFSRVDVHFDCRNITIRDSKIGNLRLNGGGRLFVENVEFNNNLPISMRGDYGGSWDGDITIKNCIVKADESNADIRLLGFNRGDYDFGYDVINGRNIVIENITLDLTKNPNHDATKSIVSMYGDGAWSYAGKRPTMYDNLTVKNIQICNKSESNKSGFTLSHIIRPQLLKSKRKGGFKKSTNSLQVDYNTFLTFDNIELDKRYSSVFSALYVAFYCTVTTSTQLAEYDEYSVYPKLIIKNCKEVKLQPRSAVVDISVFDSSVTHINAVDDNYVSSSNSKITLARCEIKPKFRSDTGTPSRDSENVFRLSHEFNAYDSMLYAVEFDDVRNFDKSLKSSGMLVIQTDQYKVVKTTSSLKNMVLNPSIIEYMKTLTSSDTADSLADAVANLKTTQAVSPITQGNTSYRPQMSSAAYYLKGFVFFDTSLNKPIYWTGTNWVYSDGTTA